MDDIQNKLQGQTAVVLQIVCIRSAGLNSRNLLDEKSKSFLYPLARTCVWVRAGGGGGGGVGVMGGGYK